MNLITKETGIKAAFFLLCAACLSGITGTAGALICGMIFVSVLGNPYAEQTKAYGSKLMAACVALLGAGINLNVILEVGKSGVIYTVIGITLTFIIGMVLARFFNLKKGLAVLLCCGTAICGGSAILAAAPAMRSKSADISVALGVVFLLNALALIVFPWIGQALNLEQDAFGVWAALAIHDTSSVVGAGMQYGAQALEVATTLKLARALWIIPLVIVLPLIFLRNNDGAPAKGEQQEKQPKKYPWFILFFLGFACFFTYVPDLRYIGDMAAQYARHGLFLVLFFIGLSLNRDILKSVGLSPLLHGVILWLIVSAASLGAILSGMIDLNIQVMGQ